MKVLYGTKNSAKLNHMRRMLDGLDIEVIGLRDIELNVEIEENGKDPLENAMIKAKTYYKKSGIPCMSADSGLYIEGLDEKEQPGVFVRRVNGKELDDEAFISYYQKIALKMGGKAYAKFRNAICLIIDDNHVFTHDDDDISDQFILTSEISPKRVKGFPMDSIALDIETGHYFVEDENTKNEIRLQEGIQNFIINCLEQIKKQ